MMFRKLMLHEIFHLVRSGAFVRRPLSWIAVYKNYFLKIPRLTNDIFLDLFSPLALEKAVYEYKMCRFLYEITAMCSKPLFLLPGTSCLVFERVHGNDLWRLLKEVRGKEKKRYLKMCIDFISIVHSYNDLYLKRIKIREKDYSKFVGPEDYVRIQRLMNKAKKVIVIEGFEIRNFIYTFYGELKFFDPHKIILGVAEDDIARFVISLLMINWGRLSKKFYPWINFKLEDIIKFYEENRSVSIDEEMFRLMFWWNYRMRRYYAEESIRRMGRKQRFFAKIYFHLFFDAIKQWGVANGL